MIDGILKESKNKMNKTIDNLKSEFASIRSGRAHSSILDQVKVDVYGSEMPINQLATIIIPESRSITIQPWDKNVLTDIEKAIRKSDLGLNPINEGNVIRINLPELTEERRKEMSKLAKVKEEEGKISIRNIRRAGNEQMKELEESEHLSEDDIKAGLNEMQKITDKFIEEINELISRKEKDIMTV